MLFQSSLHKELSRSFGATLIVLVTIVMTIMLIRTLGLASRGSVNPAEIVQVMGYTVLGHLPTIMTLSLFVAIVGTLARMYAQSEMVIWFASGRGLRSFLGPVLRFAWPVLLGIALLALLAWPWTNQQTQNMRVRYEKRGDLERVAPGQFQESAGGKRVFFIDKDSPDNKTGNNVFISTVENGRESVLSAQKGRIEMINGERFLVLDNGQHLERNLGTQELRVSDFASYGMRIDSDVLASTSTLPRTRPSHELLSNPSPGNMGELSWRVGLTLAAFNLVILSLAVSSVAPRASRNSNLVFAVLTFFVYYNLISIGQSWIASGRWPAVPFIFLLHGGVLALALGWLTLRHHHLTLWSLLQPRQWLRRRSPA